MQTFIKLMPQFDSFQHIFSRSLIGWVMCVFYLKSQKISLKGSNSRLLVLRGVIGSVSMFGFFYILTNIPFGSAVAIKYLSPIFTSIFAIFLLNEKVVWVQWVAFIACFTGILLLKGFDVRISGFDLFIGVMSSVFGGLLYIVIRKIGDDDHPIVILHYFLGICTVISGVICLRYWHNWPHYKDSLGLLGIGVVGFFAQNYFTKSIQEASEVSSLANLRYLEAAYALIIGYFVFGEVYGFWSFIGLTSIFFGLVLIIIHKSKPDPSLKKE